jgi:hypothetical protein
MQRILFNDASLNGQFPDQHSFSTAFSTILAARRLLARSGYKLEICRNALNRRVGFAASLREAVSRFSPDQRRLVFVWLDRDGPFWDAEPMHSFNEYFESLGVIVTETGLAEAAMLRHEGYFSIVISLSPSDFCITPIVVVWRESPKGDLSFELENYWNGEAIGTLAESLEQPPTDWDGLLRWIDANCPFILLHNNVRESLGGQFISNVSNRCQVLLPALNDIAQAVVEGNRSKYNELRRIWMEGGEARFTDCSEPEKQAFAKDMTFTKPSSGHQIQCFWHGKIQTPQFRIHFEWPIPQDQKHLFVAYIGPKISKR